MYETVLAMPQPIRTLIGLTSSVWHTNRTILARLGGLDTVRYSHKYSYACHVPYRSTILSAITSGHTRRDKIDSPPYLAMV